MEAMSAFILAGRFVGLKEVPGATANPQILAMLRLDDAWPADDAVPWCSAFVNFIAWLLRLSRSKSLAARSWLNVGKPIPLADAKADADIVILASSDKNVKRGHVGFFAGVEGDYVLVLGGNQGNSVSIARFHRSEIIGVRRLA